MRLKHILTTILFITSLILYYNLTSPAQNLTTSQISKIIDGDTLILTDKTKIRLLGINTPESSQPYYEEAKQFLTDLVQNKTVQIKTKEQDKYGRTLGYIFLENQNINAEILENGLATLYYYEKDNYYPELQKAEEFARLNQKGIWKKSPNSECIEIIEFTWTEPESLTLQNICNFPLNITYKDDATHIYQATINPKSQYSNNFSHIWNTDGDSIYIYDNKGLISFKRYE